MKRVYILNLFNEKEKHIRSIALLVKCWKHFICNWEKPMAPAITNSTQHCIGDHRQWNEIRKRNGWLR